MFGLLAQGILTAVFTWYIYSFFGFSGDFPLDILLAFFPGYVGALLVYSAGPVYLFERIDRKWDSHRERKNDKWNKEWREQRELERLQELYQNTEHRDIPRKTFRDIVLLHMKVDYPKEYEEFICNFIDEVYELEQLGKKLVPPNEFDSDIKTILRQYEYQLKNYKEVSKEGIIVFGQQIALALDSVFQHFPKGNTLFHIPFIEAVRDTDFIDQFFGMFYQMESKVGLPRGIKARLDLNLRDASYIYNKSEDRTLPPSQYQGDDVVSVYFKGTPLVYLLSLEVPWSIPEKSWFSHCHIVGGTDAGKTQFLSQLILYFLKTNDTLVVVDSQGDLIPRLAPLKEIQDRLIYIDPTDPPHINLFDEGVMEAFDYLFGMLGADLTAKQSVFFRFVARLMMSVPGAGLMDMLKIMKDTTPYQQYIDQLPQVQRDFFKDDFQSKTFSQTKEQVRYRLNAILENPTLQTLFEPGDTIDIAHALDNGKIVLVDTSKEHLKGASPYFGRIFISLVLKAIYNRASQEYRHPVHLIIDEAQEYFDNNIDEMLTQVRKYKMGCVFAHQFLGQCTQQLRNSLAANTSIKMVSGVSAPDAAVLAKELRTTPEFILAQPQLTFATYVRNVTSKAISLPVTPGLLDKELHVIRKKASKTEINASPEVTTKNVNNIDTSASDKW